MREDCILRIENLTVSIGTKRIVKGVSMDIPKNSWVCLVGESGSGKTMTALSLTRLVREAQLTGSVIWCDGTERNLLAMRQQQMRGMRGRHVAYVFQDPHGCLNPVMTIGEQMAETYAAHFRCNAQEAKKAALASLSEVRLEARRVFDSYPHELSGGMKQRVMIATALLTGPKLLVADEPTTALDVTIEKEILDLLQDLRTEWPVSYFFITHNIALASRVADLIYVMKDGLIVEKMEKGAKGFEPRDAYTKKLFRAGLEHVKPKTEIDV